MVENNDGPGQRRGREPKKKRKNKGKVKRPPERQPRRTTLFAGSPARVGKKSIIPSQDAGKPGVDGVIRGDRGD